jgi:thioredoxin-like negative regulator of GroEL
MKTKLLKGTITFIALFSRSLPIASAHIIEKSGKISSITNTSDTELEAAIEQEMKRLPLLFALIREKLYRKIAG